MPKKLVLEKETNEITARKIRLRSKIKFAEKLKKEIVAALIDELPNESESLHIVSNGSFDYFQLVPHIIEKSGKKCTDFWFSTWTMSAQNVMQILKMYDDGILANINALTGEYFRTREFSVYQHLKISCDERGQKVFSNKNHAKVTLIAIENAYYVIEGSANFTANPRIEQFVLSNSKELFEFHKKWMSHLFKTGKYNVE